MPGLKHCGSFGRSAAAPALLALALLAGCGSQVSTPNGDQPPGGTAGSGTGGSTGAIAGAGAGGSGLLSPTASKPEVGMVTLRRLNRTEYANTLRDLTGVTADYSGEFPPENLSFGFDNIGEALTVQPLHIEVYERTAEAVINDLFARPATDPFRARYLTCDPASGRACVVKSLQTLAQYAYRRNVPDAEVASLADIQQSFASTGGDATEGLKIAFKGVLLSPHFLFRVELDPVPTAKEPHRLAGFELASRLSYFFWSTMPDEELFVQAQGGGLLTDAVLSAQIERLLADPKAKALVSNFAGQWLNLRRVAQSRIDAKTYPTFDEDLRASLRTESELFFTDLLTNGKPVSELLSGAYTFINKRLATHYGLTAPSSDNFERVDLTGTPRRGLLTQGSFLTLTSNPTRTSPVKRGKWVLDQLLCSPPPPPPPGVDSAALDSGAMSLRQLLEQHRAKEPCKSCHAVMDPIGLSFENFDGIGAYRAADSFGPIDATGTLPMPSGQNVSFNGAGELMPLLASDERLPICAAEKVLTYAVGRGFTADDALSINAVLKGAAASNKGLRGLIASAALTEAFRSRRAVGE